MSNYNTCPVCCQEILETDSKQMIGLDKPYINIWFHKACFLSLDYYTEVVPILLRDVNLWYNRDISNITVKKEKIMRKNKKK